MVGALIDGVATDEQIEVTGRELPKLYEGRAPAGTLMWFRANQSLRIFKHVRESLARGQQPDAAGIKRIGYLMRNTGLDGNGTFGTTSFKAIPAGHPLQSPYFAQMLSAYLMRELSVDVVEELARLDNPEGAVPLAPQVRRFIGVGNGSALGLVMFVYNRPKLIHSYVSAYLDALGHALAEPIGPEDPRFDLLEGMLDRTISYRALEDTDYRVFTSSRQIAADLRRIRTVVRAARRGEVPRHKDETLLGAAHRFIRGRVSSDAIESFNSLLLELVPEYCDRLVEERLGADEELPLDPSTSVGSVLEAVTAAFSWALELPLNDDSHRDRIWYQSRAAEEPRSGPREEVPGAHDVVIDYPVRVRELHAALLGLAPDDPIGKLLFERPELEQVTRHVVALRDCPYAVPHADPHDSDFVPVWLVRLMNSFIHGLDRTEDYLGRIIRGLIFEGAPFSDELADADPSTWWWSARAVPVVPSPMPRPLGSSQTAAKTPADGASVPVLAPHQSSIVPHEFPAEDRLVVKLREARLVGGRAMQALNVPEGSWHGAREFFVAAIASDPAAVADFGAVLAAGLDAEGKAGPWRRPVADLTSDRPRIDCHGQSLLLVGHSLANLLAAVAAAGEREIEIASVVPGHALEGLRLVLGRYGVEAGVEELGEQSFRLRLVRPADPERNKGAYREAISRFVRSGLELPAQIWWNVYFPSNAGLYPDTPISRQHTGTTLADVVLPGQQITRHLGHEELMGSADPDDADHRNASYFAQASAS
jgi:hypothetical protein